MQSLEGTWAKLVNITAPGLSGPTALRVVTSIAGMSVATSLPQ